LFNADTSVKRDEVLRRVLLLHPRPDASMSQDDKRALINVVTELRGIVRSANKKLKDVLSAWTWGAEPPLVVVEPVSLLAYKGALIDEDMLDDQAVLLDEDKKGVRVCLTNILNHPNSKRYEGFFNKFSGVFRKEHLEPNDISHLVSLQIDFSTQETIWSRVTPEGAPFDAQVIANMRGLEKVIVCIGLDIVFYHAFGLCASYEKRVAFRRFKCDYIRSHSGLIYTESASPLVDIYGSSELPVDGFLPLSYAYIGDMVGIAQFNEDIERFQKAFNLLVLAYRNASNEVTIPISGGKFEVAVLSNDQTAATAAISNYLKRNGEVLFGKYQQFKLANEGAEVWLVLTQALNAEFSHTFLRKHEYPEEALGYDNPSGTRVFALKVREVQS